jgi:hypothetical protein
MAWLGSRAGLFCCGSIVLNISSQIVIIAVMPSLDDVYRKYGETAEAAQLLETELGSQLLEIGAATEKLFAKTDSGRAAELVDKINSHTLGQLLKRLSLSTQLADELQTLLMKALEERNRLSPSFYRQHNLRRNSDAGRAIMMDDLASIHQTILSAYKAVLLLVGVDLEAMHMPVPPTGHLPI